MDYSLHKILNNIGLTELSEMQHNAAEVACSNLNTVLLAPTGSGKTLAFLLPLVKTINEKDDSVQALILSPTRELALQTMAVLNAMKTGVRALCCYGGHAATLEHRKLSAARPQIIIGTPGRLNDHIEKGNINSLSIKTLVVDEFDKMLDFNFQDEIEQLFDRLPSRKRCILVSATDMRQIPEFIAFRHNSPAILNYLEQDGGAVLSKIRHFIVQSPDKDKLLSLDCLLRTMGAAQSIVFVNYRDAAERTALWLADHGHSVSLFHGGLDQNTRETALWLFRDGCANVLVSTELSARGIDIPSLHNVIHYHLPTTSEAYIHRCGRTARWEGEGNSFIIIGPQEELPSFLRNDSVVFQPHTLPHHLPPLSHPEWAMLYIGRGKRDKLSKGDIVGFLCKSAGCKAADIGAIHIKEHYSHVAVKSTMLKHILLHTAGEKIKKMSTIIEPISTKQLTHKHNNSATNKPRTAKKT